MGICSSFRIMFQLFVSQTDGDVSGELEYHLESGSGV